MLVYTKFEQRYTSCNVCRSWKVIQTGCHLPLLLGFVCFCICRGFSVRLSESLSKTRGFHLRLCGCWLLITLYLKYVFTCRAYWRNVTQCVRSICFSRINSTIWSMIPVIKPYNVADVMIYSSSGLPGGLRLIFSLFLFDSTKTITLTQSLHTRITKKVNRVRKCSQSVYSEFDKQ